MDYRRVYASLFLSLLFSKGRASSCTDCDGRDVTCVDGVCSPLCVNMMSSGDCLQCRGSRFYGKQCENVCPHTCLNSRCQLDNSRVVCTEGCVAGKKGDNCEVDCPSICTQCERYGDRCVEPCKGNTHYGKHCENECPSTCLHSRCQLKQSRVECTEGCVAGKKGDRCDVDCPRSCKQCERNGVRCVGPCKSHQYHGTLCVTPCPSNCRDGCNVTNSIVACTGGCISGKMGSKSEVDCQRSCTSCEQFGQRCIGPCANQLYFGEGCEKNCPSNCRGGCDRDTGECVSCESGYTGMYCSYPVIHLAPGAYNSAFVAVGVIIVVVVVTGFIIFLAVLRNKTLSKKSTFHSNVSLRMEKIGKRLSDTISSSQCVSTTTPTYMPSGDAGMKLVSYCEELRNETANVNEDYIVTEFFNLPPPDIKVAKCGSDEINSGKNRYSDVLPYDKTRVLLETEAGNASDYINASFIEGYGQDIGYVAAQGPSLQVVDDFWRMIWQLKTTKIVMLTSLVEAGKVKCEMYWPHCSSEYQSYGKVCVQCVEEKVYQVYTLRTLAVWKGKSETRTVRQFHFTAWPDHGVPEETDSIIDFHRVVKDTGPNELGPMVIHCSAGVGRTGTFIALGYLLDQARYEGSVCIFKCIQDFRFQRMKMVQTKAQYKFLYCLLASALQYRGTTPLHYSPVQLQCKNCWNKKNNQESPDEETSLEENDKKYQPLWNFGRENREDFLPDTSKSLPDVCAIISEDSPPSFENTSPDVRR